MQITPRARLMPYARLLRAVLEMIPLSRQLPCARGWLGRS